MLRRELLKLAGTVSGICMLGSSRLVVAEPPQKFRIGMAATLWLASSPSTGTYWKASEALAGLHIGATEADNSQARLDTAYGSHPSEFKRRSLALGVYLSGVFQGLRLHETSRFGEMRSKIDSVAGFLKAAGAKYIALGWDAPGAVGGVPYRRTPQDVKNAVRNMNELGRVSEGEHGIMLTFHAERDVPKEVFVQVLDDTDPQYVHLCADVGHITAMGLNAVDVVRKYSARLAVSHWKDFDPKLPAPGYLGGSARGDFVEVGKGIVDFKGLSRLYRQIGFGGWVMIELDRTRLQSKLASANAMKAYVTDQLGLNVYGIHHAAPV